MNKIFQQVIVLEMTYKKAYWKYAYASEGFSHYLLSGLSNLTTDKQSPWRVTMHEWINSSQCPQTRSTHTLTTYTIHSASSIQYGVETHTRTKIYVFIRDIDYLLSLKFKLFYIHINLPIFFNVNLSNVKSNNVFAKALLVWFFFLRVIIN